MAHLKCEFCGNIKEVPECCNRSMIIENDYLICCCSGDCAHQPIPNCCGTKMKYIE